MDKLVAPQIFHTIQSTEGPLFGTKTALPFLHLVRKAIQVGADGLPYFRRGSYLREGDVIRADRDGLP